MIKEALEYLVKLGTKPVSIDNRTYYPTAEGLQPVLDPLPVPLIVHTLTGIVDYILTENEPIDFLHIIDHERVNVCSWLISPWQRRMIYLTSQVDNNSSFAFREWYSHEQFIIELQSKFIKTEIRDNIARIVGNISDESIRNVIDDGTTQEVHVKNGIRIANDFIPNPVVLQPYRTFREIEQPSSNFVLRIRPQKGELPQIALYDADGASWKLEAIRKIKEWLHDKLPEVSIIA